MNNTDGPILSEAQKWAALEAGDSQYDHLFYYGAKTTGIFCLPSCTSKKPLRSNIVFFDTSPQAVFAGFRPCKRCRPDLVRYERDRKMAEKAMLAIRDNFHQPVPLKSFIGELGLSQDHLANLFKIHYGVTPSQYRADLRLAKAMNLLLTTSDSISSIQLACGFQSASNFYSQFKKSTGMSPGAFRRKKKAE